MVAKSTPFPVYQTPGARGGRYERISTCTAQHPPTTNAPFIAQQTQNQVVETEQSPKMVAQSAAGPGRDEQIQHTPATVDQSFLPNQPTALEATCTLQRHPL